MTAHDHTMHWFTNTKDQQVKLSCDCGQTSFWQDSKQVCEDWKIRHLANVERVRTYLEKRNPSLESQCDYYHSMVELEPEEPRRELWKMLAHELDVRLGRVGPQWEDVEIPYG